MRKKLIALFFLYALQFLSIACTSECGDFSGPSAYEIDYTDINLMSFDTSGFQSMVAENNIPKNAFGLVIQFVFDQNPIAKQESFLNLSGFGFNTALACSPVPPQYIYNDPIFSLKIFVTDTLSNANIDVTNNFTVTDFNGDVVPFATYFQNREDAMSNFQLDLALLDSIPDTSIFTVNITLESGAVISKSTNTLTFI